MLTSTTTNVARFGTLGARGLQLQTTAFTRGATGTCPYSTLIAASSVIKGQCSTRKTITKTTVITKSLAASPLKTSRRIPSQQQRRFTARRHASSTSTPSSSTPTSTTTSTSTSTSALTSRPSAAKASSGTATSQQEPTLDWDTFFRLRKTRRRIQLASSAVTTVAGAGAGAMLLVNQDPEWLLGSIPMDPIFSLGLLTMACAGLGWLAGPVLGSTLFHRLARRGIKGPMAAKEAEFFARIRKHRVDPTTSSVQNPVPDFYGEKISSVAGYRQWLKDQRAFNKKRTSFV